MKSRWHANASRNEFKPGTPVRVESWPLRSGKFGGFVKQSTNLETNEVLEVRE